MDKAIKDDIDSDKNNVWNRVQEEFECCGIFNLNNTWRNKIKIKGRCNVDSDYKYPYVTRNTTDSSLALPKSCKNYTEPCFFKLNHDIPSFFILIFLMSTACMTSPLLVVSCLRS